MKEFNVAVVGVGAVGREILKVLKKRNFPVKDLKVLARSARDIEVEETVYPVEEISHEAFAGIDLALFAGTEGEQGASVTYAPSAVREGAVVIDNGRDFRLKEEVPLIIPEVNADQIKNHKGIIANPNCSTIQMVLSIYPIHKLSGIERIIVSTYQAASGAGQKAADELFSQTREFLEGKDLTIEALPKRLAFNVIPQIGSFAEDEYTTEEWKMVKETHKILNNSRIKITSTCVRVPVKTGHSQAIYLETKEEVSLAKAKEALEKQPGIKIIDDPKNKRYPLPFECEGKDEVFIGRLRKDPFVKNGLWLWAVSDNLLKGAALNAVQIAEHLISDA
jgi:aspartate-semialdehyde dehydrogenase